MEKELFKEILKRNLWLNQGEKVKEMVDSISQHERNQLLIEVLEEIIKEKGYSPAPLTANFLEEPERSRQLNQLLKRFTEEGWFGLAKNTVELLKRKLTVEELIQIIRACIARNYMEDARKAAELLPEPKRTEILKFI